MSLLLLLPVLTTLLPEVARLPLLWLPLSLLLLPLWLLPLPLLLLTDMLDLSISTPTWLATPMELWSLLMSLLWLLLVLPICPPRLLLPPLLLLLSLLWLLPLLLLLPAMLDPSTSMLRPSWPIPTELLFPPMSPLWLLL